MRKKSFLHVTIMLCICFMGLLLTTGCGKCTNSCGHSCGSACTPGGILCEGCLHCLGCSGCLGCVYGCLGYDLE